MSSFYSVRAIPLSWSHTREADRWYQVLTPDRGKVRFRARGANKPLAKLTPHLEMIGEVELLLVVGRKYDTVIGAHRVKAFPSVLQDVSKLVLARNAIHLLDLATHPNEPDHKLFSLLQALLTTLESSPELSQTRAQFFLHGFALRLIEVFGYRPELNQCLACQNPVEAEAFRWHPLKGGVVCESCVMTAPDQWFAARRMDSDVLKMLRFALEAPMEDQWKPHLRGDAIASFAESIESLLVSHFPVIPANSLRASCCT